MLCRMSYFLHPCERLLHFEAATVWQVLLYFLVVTSCDVSRDSLGWIIHVCQSVPKASFDVASRSSGNHGYIRKPGTLLCSLNLIEKVKDKVKVKVHTPNI